MNQNNIFFNQLSSFCHSCESRNPLLPDSGHSQKRIPAFAGMTEEKLHIASITQLSTEKTILSHNIIGEGCQFQFF
jgi:hypothetical protein